MRSPARRSARPGRRRGHRVRHRRQQRPPVPRPAPLGAGGRRRRPGHPVGRRRHVPGHARPGVDQAVRPPRPRGDDQLPAHRLGRRHPAADVEDRRLRRLRRAPEGERGGGHGRAPGAVVQVPWTAGGVAVEYNLPGVEGLRLTPAGGGRHLCRSHHEVERSRHQGREPEGDPARRGHSGGAPLRRVGHHPGLHRLPQGRGPGRVDLSLGQGLAGGHAGHRRQGLRRRDRGGQAVRRMPSATPSPATPSRPASASPPSATRPGASSPRKPTR